MKYHVCSVSYKTSLAIEVMAERAGRVARRFASSRGYEVVEGEQKGERYVVRTVCAERRGYVMVSPGLVQFFAYVMGAQETLAQAHAVEGEMGVLMEAEFSDSERLPGTLLNPLRTVKEFETVDIDEALLKIDLSQRLPGSIDLN